MMNFFRQTLVLLLVSVFLAAPDAPARAQAAGCALGAPAESRTEPPVERAHLFCGEVNRRDRGTGFHHRPGGRDPESARIGRVTGRNEATGIYTAEGIEVLEAGAWHAKRGFSSFYPDACTPLEVLASIAHAAGNALCRYPNGKWRGNSAPGPGAAGDGYCLGDDGSVLTIEGYWRTEVERIVRTGWPLIDPRPAPACR